MGWVILKSGDSLAVSTAGWNFQRSGWGPNEIVTSQNTSIADL